MVFEWNTGKAPFWETVGLGALLFFALAFRFGELTLFGLMPLALVLFRLYRLGDRQQQFAFADVTGWWWLPTHVVVCLGIHRFTIRRSEVGANKYAQLRRLLLENSKDDSGRNRL